MMLNKRRSSSHDELAALLPWYVNGTLKGEELAKVQAHVAECPKCRTELAVQRGLSERLARAPVPELSPQLALARLRNRMERSGEATVPPVAVPRKSRIQAASSYRRRRFDPRYLVHTAIAAGVLLLVLPIDWKHLERWAEPGFHTLSDRPSRGESELGDLRLVLDRSLDAARREALMDAIGGQRLESPGAGDVITVRLSGAGAGKPDVVAAVEYLRRQKGVLFVEPIFQPEGP